MKAEICGKEMKDKFIKERFETRITFFDSITISKLKIFESANKRLWSRHQIKDILNYKQQENIAFQLLVQGQCLDEKVNMKLLMSFSLTPVLLSIGTIY